MCAKKITNFEWRLGVTSCSSESDDPVDNGMPFVHLSLILEGGQCEVMEMTLPQFYDMMHQLESAKEQLALVS